MIALIDVDYLEGISIMPNPWLMKLSSYYKQQGREVSLIDKVNKIESYSEIIIAKESPTNFLPSVALLISEKTKLIGKAFEKQTNYWDLPFPVYQARPDYNLYKFDFPSELTAASFISLTYRGNLIETQPQARDHRARALNIVIDRGLWASKDLDKILDRLAAIPKLVFLEPVEIIFLKNNDLIKKFANLRLNNRPIYFKNFASLEELTKTVILLNKVKKIKTISHEKVKYIAFNPSNDLEEISSSFIKCLKAAGVANKEMVEIEFLIPKSEEYDQYFLWAKSYKQKRYSLLEYYIEKVSKGLDTETLNLINYIKEKDYEAYELGFTKWGGNSNSKYRKELDK